MNLSRCMRLKIKPKRIIPPSLYVCPIRCSSAEASEMVTDQKMDEEVLSIRPRVQRRKPPIEPFAKNLFASIFDSEILAFPEILNKEEITSLEKRIESIKNVLYNSNQTDEEISNVFKNNRIYGAPATVFHGGYASNVTERLRMLEEMAKYRIDIARDVSQQWAGISAIMAAMSEDDISAIMPDIANGKFGVQICVKERLPKETHVPDIRTSANFTGPAQYKVCGEKMTSRETHEGTYLLLVATVRQDTLQSLLVRPGAPGVSHRGRLITFSDTPADTLGKDMMQWALSMNKEEGMEYPRAPLQQALSEERLQTAAMCNGLLITAISETVQNIKGKYVSGKPMNELPLIRNRIADAVSVLYTSESMLYLTAGLLDGYEKPDIDLEAILCRIYSTRETFRVILSLYEALKSSDLDGDLDKCLSASQTLLCSDGQNDALTVYGALLGLQHTGKIMQNTVLEKRNPLMYPMTVMRSVMDDMLGRNGDPRLTLELANFLHPSLREPAGDLEAAVLSVRPALEQALIHHGQAIIENHRDLQRMTELVLHVFGMTAALSRASRAYCIGLRHSERELYQAVLNTTRSRAATRILVEQLKDGMHLTKDTMVDDIGKDTFRLSGVPMEHCLTRVFF